jgi:UDPglucose--hexose-1-phosphate uridylyltransferase
MPELRKDPVRGQWVIVGTERPRRPSDFYALDPAPPPGPCSLCAGHEAETPPELLAYRPADVSGRDGPGWRVRVVPSRFPAFRVEGELARRGMGLYDVMNAVGAHELVIESPAHDARPGTLPLDAFEDLLHAFQARTIDLRRDPRIRSVRAFRAASGALPGIGHPHSQILATPTVPDDLAAALVQARAYHDYRERCLFCDIIAQETEDGRRIVIDDDAMVAFVPFAATSPFETWILPRRHSAAFDHVTTAERSALARTLHTLIRRVESVVGPAATAFVLQSAPVGDEQSRCFHWHLQLHPRVGCKGGTAADGGYVTNPLLPEDAVQLLRATRRA